MARSLIPIREEMQRSGTAGARPDAPRSKDSPLVTLLIAGVAGALTFAGVLLVAGGTDIRGAVSRISLQAGAEITVVDGDTVRVNGRLTRLVGFNTPETYQPQCEGEAALGRQATARLHQIIASGTPSVKTVRCACRPGTEGTEACNYARACGELTVDGKSVGAILISEGLAAPFVCSGTDCPPTPRPWCASS
jgi:endonuclease YncB( thermonuclease family)